MRDEALAARLAWRLRTRYDLDYSREAMLIRPSGTISVTIANELIDAAAKKRAACEAINSRVGVSRVDLEGRSETIPLAAFTSMLEVAAYEASNETFGLELGRDFKLSAFGPLSALMASADTLGSALEKFSRYFGLLQTNTRSDLKVNGGVARLSYLVIDPTARFRVQDAAFTIAQHYSMIERLLGTSPKVIGADFEHSAGNAGEKYVRHFSAPIRFNQRDNALLFDAHLLERPIAISDRKVHRQIEVQIAEAHRKRTIQFGLEQCVEDWVTASVCQSAPTNIEYIAGDFGMSTRSFRRKLAESGLTYVDIRDRIRLTIARCMLSETSRSITSIALQLGYSETSAFCRNFKRQAGTTPAEFRRKGTSRQSSRAISLNSLKSHSNDLR
jgi:AraC-like DNA-binding protein